MKKVIFLVLLFVIVIGYLMGAETEDGAKGGRFRAVELSFGFSVALETHTEESRIGYELVKEIIVYSPTNFKFVYESQTMKILTTYVAVNLSLPAGIYYYPSKRFGIGLTYSLGGSFEYPLSQEQSRNGVYLGVTKREYLLPQASILNILHIANKIGNASSGNLFLLEYGFANKITFSFSKDESSYLSTTPYFGPSFYIGAEIRRKKISVNIGGALKVLFEVDRYNSANYVESYNITIGPELRVRGSYFRRLSD